MPFQISKRTHCEDFLLTKSRQQRPSRWSKCLFRQKLFMLSMSEGKPGYRQHSYTGRSQEKKQVDMASFMKEVEAS